ncbi:MAG: ATP-binding protein [Firmicutes bacterium]|nr:ATP-binding protein [Bacillota bacterium]
MAGIPLHSTTGTDAGLGPNAPESELFVRAEDWQTLWQNWRKSESEGRAVYLTGPSGVGKSTCLAAFSRALKARSATVIATAASQISPTPGAILQHLSQHLGECPDIAQALAALNRRGAQSGAVWLIDDYQAWRPLDRWFRAEVLPRLGPGVMVVLAGVEPLQRLWAGDRLAQARIAEISVRPWADSIVREYLAAMGIGEAWYPEVLAIAGGLPALLAPMADAILADGGSLQGGTTPQRWSFLVERALHPGSRRMAWRAGYAAASVDTLVAAASLVPYFNRPLLEALVGREVVGQHWQGLIDSPVTRALEPGVFSLSGSLRRGLIPLVEEARPWMWRQWLRRATAWAVQEESLGSHRMVAEGILAEVTARGLMQFRLPLPAYDRFRWTGRLCPDARLGLQVIDEDRPLPLAEASWTVSGSGVLDVVAFRAPQDLPGAEYLLWGALFAHLAIHTEGDWPELRSRHGSMPALWPPREFSQWPFANPKQVALWIDAMMRPHGAPASEKERSEWVREAMVRLQQPEDLLRCRLAGLYPGHPTPLGIRRWIFDALTSADLENWAEARAILSLYYVERRYSHEALAERLHLSRASYFRMHQRALKQLADQLLGQSAPEADHPTGSGQGLDGRLSG